MAGRIKLVVTDLDNTLWTGNGDVPMETLRSIDEARGRGVTVLAATSRRLGAVKLFFERAGLQLPSILLNGAIGTTVPTNPASGEFFLRRPLSKEQALQIVRVFQSHGIAPQVYVESMTLDLVCTRSPSSGDSYVEFMRPFMTFVEDLEAFVQSNEVYGVSVIGCNSVDSLNAVAAELQQTTDASVSFHADSCYGGHTMVIGVAGATKWNAVLQFCERYDFDPNAVLAVGDGLNDVDLMENAAIGCAMSHAEPAVIEAADYVLSHGTRGWSGILAHI